MVDADAEMLARLSHRDRRGRRSPHHSVKDLLRCCASGDVKGRRCAQARFLGEVPPRGVWRWLQADAESRTQRRHSVQHLARATAGIIADRADDDPDRCASHGDVKSSDSHCSGPASSSAVPDSRGNVIAPRHRSCTILPCAPPGEIRGRPPGPGADSGIPQLHLSTNYTYHWVVISNLTNSQYLDHLNTFIESEYQVQSRPQAAEVRQRSGRRSRSGATRTVLSPCPSRGQKADLRLHLARTVCEQKFSGPKRGLR